MANNIVVLYHAECSDGFAAAWACWKKLGRSAVYIAVPPSNATLPPIALGKHVFTLDYSFPEHVIKTIKKNVASLTVIDHHVTNKEAVQYATASVFSINHSGAVLAWKYFYPKKPVPQLLRYIEDYDLWRFRLPYTKALAEAISLRDSNVAVWSRMARDFEDAKKRREYVKEGMVLIQRLKKTVGRLSAHAEPVEFEGYTCLMVNSPTYVNDLGEVLIKKAKSPLAIIWSRRENKVTVSLRGDGTVDLARLAEKYGGGGHRDAAGFSWQQKQFLTFKKHGRKSKNVA